MWRPRYAILKDEVLMIFKSKKGKLKQNLRTSDLIVKFSEETPLVLEIFTGIKKILMQLENQQEARKWLNAIQISHDSAKKSNIKMEALREVLNSCESDTNVGKQLQVLLSEDYLVSLEKGLSNVNEKLAAFKELTTQVFQVLDKNQTKEVLKLENLAQELRNEMMNSCNSLQEEHKNLIVVHEVLKKSLQNYKQDFTH